MNLFRRAWAWIVVFFGMSGLRLDRARDGKRFAFTVLAWVAFVLSGFVLWQTDWPGFSKERIQKFALSYAAAVWCVYYIGNSMVLGSSRFRRWMIARWGEETAYRRYESVIGIVYLNQGLCQSAILAAFPGTLSGILPVAPAAVAGFLLLATGTGAKWWATRLTGLDAYYYRDMFLGRASKSESGSDAYVVSGPYKVFDNPMYGIGYVQGYGIALLHLSWEYLLCAAIFHASIYGFYFLFERPFVKQAYRVPEKSADDGDGRPMRRLFAWGSRN